MTDHLALLRGINVGGRNKVPMAALKQLLESLGFDHVATYLQSGNAMLRSSLAAQTIAKSIEENLTSAFMLDSSIIKVLVLTRDQVQAVIDKRPKGFGDQPDTYHSDAIFPIDIGVAEAMTAFSPLEGVDTIWAGDGVIYSQRLTALRTKSRLNRMMASPLYQSMTIRSWGTMLEILEKLAPNRAA